MPLDQTGNFQRTEITDGFPMAAADTDIYIDGGVSVFPDPANGEFNLVIFDQTQHARPDQDPNVEIVRATSRLSSVELAVDRAQEGTSAADHPAGSAVLLAATSKMFDDVAATDQPVENFTSNSTTAGEVLTSNGSGGVEFAAASAASITRNGNEIEYVALDISNLPQPIGSNDVALVTASDEYVVDNNPISGTPFDITSSAFALDTSINTQDGGSTGIAFNNDGSRLYEVGEDSEKIYQSTLSTPFDIGSASFSTSINSQSSFPADIAWNDDGSRLYEVSSGNIFQSTLSTPFEISTASFSSSSETASGSACNGIAWNNDGSRLFEVSGGGFDSIYQSTVSTPFDATTASLTKQISTQDGTPTGIAWNNDGSRLYEVGDDSDKIYQSTLSTPFDIGSASFSTSIPTQEITPTDITWNDDGSRLYELNRFSEKIYQYNLLAGGWESL